MQGGEKITPERSCSALSTAALSEEQSGCMHPKALHLHHLTARSTDITLTAQFCALYSLTLVKRKSSSVPELPFPTAEFLTSFPLLCADEQQLFHVKWKTRDL